MGLCYVRIFNSESSDFYFSHISPLIASAGTVAPALDRHRSSSCVFGVLQASQPHTRAYLSSGGLPLRLMRRSSTRIASSRLLMPNTAKGRAIHRTAITAPRIITRSIAFCPMSCIIAVSYRSRLRWKARSIPFPALTKYRYSLAPSLDGLYRHASVWFAEQR